MKKAIYLDAVKNKYYYPQNFVALDGWFVTEMRALSMSLSHVSLWHGRKMKAVSVFHSDVLFNLWVWCRNV